MRKQLIDFLLNTSEDLLRIAENSEHLKDDELLAVSLYKRDKMTKDLISIKVDYENGRYKTILS